MGYFDFKKSLQEMIKQAEDSSAEWAGNEYIYRDYVGSGPRRRTLTPLHAIKLTWRMKCL